MNVTNLASVASTLAAVVALISAPPHTFADSESILQSQCAACHDLKAPETEIGISERFGRLAPPLHFAGNKYNRDWLVDWLVAPEPVHPAGYFPQRRIVNHGEGDQLDADNPFDHPALSRDDAEGVATKLMSMTSKSALIEADNYQPGTVAMRMGVMDFRRFKGCDACHQDSITSGGLSGPVLYNAAQRLQPAYLSSYIQNPVAWDPNTVMPVLDMNEPAVHRLVHYLMMLEE